MHVKLTQDQMIAPDGITVGSYLKDQTVDVADDIGESLIRAELAVKVGGMANDPNDRKPPVNTPPPTTTTPAPKK